jgi:chromosome segregation ATPase
MTARNQHQELDRNVEQICPTSSPFGATPLPELQSSKARLEAEQTKLVEEIQRIRLEAKNYSLHCQATREPQDQKESERRRQRIATLQADLMRAQAELGEVNRSLRAQKPSQVAHSRERARQQLEQRYNDFLATFHQIARDSLDPRQFAALEDGARALLREAERDGDRGSGSKLFLV